MVKSKYFLGLTGEKLNIAAILVIIAEAYIIFGYNQSLMGGIFDIPAFEDRFPTAIPSRGSASGVTYRTNIKGTITGLYAVGGLFGSISCIILGDYKGRRFSLFISSIIQIIGAIIMASSFTLAQLIVARVILGIGTGGLLATINIWQAEISSSKIRGSHISFAGLFIGGGLALSLWMDFAFYYTSGEISFRFPFAFQILFGLTIIIFVFRFPESPRFLIKKGRIDEAKEILMIIEDGILTPEEIMKNLRDQEISMKLAGEAKFWDFLKMDNQRNLNRTVLAVLSLSGLQLTGTNAISFYTQTLFSDYLGLPPNVAKPLSALYQMTSLLGGPIAALIIEKVGRKALLIGGSASCSVLMALLAGLLCYPENRSAINAATFFLYCYHLLYCIGWGGTPFLYASEVSTLAHRALINGLAVVSFWALNFMIGEVSPSAYTGIDSKYFIVWSATNAIYVPLVYYLFPETGGRSLEEIDEIFANSTGWFDCVKVARKMPVRHLFDDTSRESEISIVNDKQLVVHEEIA